MSPQAPSATSVVGKPGNGALSVLVTMTMCVMQAFPFWLVGGFTNVSFSYLFCFQRASSALRVQTLMTSKGIFRVLSLRQACHFSDVQEPTIVCCCAHLLGAAILRRALRQEDRCFCTWPSWGTLAPRHCSLVCLGPIFLFGCSFIPSYCFH